MPKCFFGHDRDEYEITCERCGEFFDACIECWLNGVKFICPEPDCNHINVRQLRGKTLVCWCKAGEPCHADVLIDLIRLLPEP